jgi:hypothetical protein
MNGGALKELLEYRKSLIDRLVTVANEFRSECLGVQDQLAPIEGGWNTHQIAVHTRDIDHLVYGARARKTAAEDNPEFPNFNGEAYMAEHYSASEPLKEITDGLVEHVEDLARMLRDLPTQAWSRESRHATLGHGLTLQTWVERDLAHIREHLQTVKNRKEE